MLFLLQDNTDSVLEAALGFTCDFTKPGGFIGKEAIEKEKATPGNAKRRLMQVWWAKRAARVRGSRGRIPCFAASKTRNQLVKMSNSVE